MQTVPYGGHLVDSDGKIVHERQSVRELMDRFPEIDRHLQKTPFQITHGIWSGTKGRQGAGSKENRLVVDGGPLTHPVLDHVAGVERGAIANSANHTKKNM